MDSHNSAHIASKVSSASSDSKVFLRVEPVCVDHEVAVILVHGCCLAAISVVEELWECLLLAFMDDVHIKPRAVAWQNDAVHLRNQVFECSGRSGLGGYADVALGGGLTSTLASSIAVLERIALEITFSVGHFLILRSGIVGGWAFGRIQRVV